MMLWRMIIAGLIPVAAISAVLTFAGAPVFASDIRARNMTGLLESARAGDLAGVRRALAAGKAIDTRDRDGRTALMFASYHGRAEVVRLLLNRGADINARTKAGYTALMYAAFGAHVGIVRRLLEKGADYRPRNKDGRTALAIARDLNRTAVTRYIRRDFLGGRLVRAVEAGNLDRARRLLMDGAEANLRLKGKTLLAVLALRGDVQSAAFFIKMGARVNAKHGAGEPLLLAVLRLRHKNMVRLLLKNGYEFHGLKHGGEPLVLWALTSRRFEFLDLLLEASASWNVRGKKGETAILRALREPAIPRKRMEIYLGKHASLRSLVDERDRHGDTPLLTALRTGRLKFARMLLKHGANPNLGNRGGLTPVLAAIERESISALKLLGEFRANMNRRNGRGTTPLLLLVYHWKDAKAARGARILLKYGAGVGDRGRHARTALWWAASRNRLETARVLLKAGADVGSRDRYGCDARTEALRMGNRRLAKLLHST